MEISLQCYLAARAAIDYDSSYEISQSSPLPDAPVSALPPGPERDRILLAQYDVFRHVHSFLTHAGNVSKLLWPSSAAKKNNESDEAYLLRVPAVLRGGELKNLYSLPQINLLEKRPLRNSLEHFDERLDVYITENQTCYTDLVIGAEDILSYSRSHIMRHALADTFYFRGEAFDLSAIANCWESIYIKSQELLQPTS